MSVIVLDTDVASALWRRRVPASVIGSLVGHEPAITFVTVGNLAAGEGMDRKGARIGKVIISH